MSATTFLTPGGEEHIIERGVGQGILTGTLYARWRCSCEGGRNCGAYDEDKSEWRFGASPERHLAEVGATEEAAR